MLINLRALIRPRLRRDGSGGTVTAIDFRLDRAGLAVLLIAGAGLAILAAYLVSEAVGHIARAAV